MFLVWLDDDADFLQVVVAHAACWNGGSRLVTTTDPTDPRLETADAWVVDLSMAGTDGFTMVERAVERGTPVAVVTSVATPHMVRELTELGASAVWEKSLLLQLFPGRPEEILQPV